MNLQTGLIVNYSTNKAGVPQDPDVSGADMLAQLINDLIDNV
jgi:hypothetical protein